MFMWVAVKIMIPFWGTLSIRCRIIIGIPKGTIVLTTTHVCVYIYIYTHTERDGIQARMLRVRVEL